MEEQEKHGAVGVLSEDEDLQQRVCASLIEASAVRSRADWLRALHIARAQEGVGVVDTEGLSIDER